MEQLTPYECIEDWRTDWAAKWREIVFKAWFNRVAVHGLASPR
jgi:hypothetical protein